MNRPDRPPIPLPPSQPLAPPDDLAAKLTELGVTLDASAIARLADYLGRLLAMNERVNLTAITSPSEAWTRHACDALTLAPLVSDLPAGSTVIDVGSGGGVPAIPLAIARPDLRFTLVESTQKKATFLRDVSAALGLTNVTVIADRAESAPAAQRGRFDVVTARAVSRLVSLLPITLPFVKPGGRALFIKGQRADEELDEARSTLARMRVSHDKTVATPTGRVIVLRVDARR